MYGYIVSVGATIMVALHLVTLKLLSMHKDIFWIVMIGVIVTLMASRILIYEAMQNMPDPTIVGVILNFAVVILFLISYFILNIRNQNMPLFISGLLAAMIGFVLMMVGQQS